MDFSKINFSAGHYVWLFLFVKIVAEKTGWVLLNPILVAIAMLICFLQFTGVSYETYSEAGSLVEFWLKPAVVALGVPLYLQLRMIKKQLMPILISQLAGCVVGLVSVTIIAKLMGASPEVIMSLAPKSVTTPIAMEVSNAVGGIPSLTAAVVIVVGLFGAICGFKLLQVGRVASPIAQGLSMGDSRPCSRYFTCHGSEWQVWCVRKSGIDLERNSYRFAFAYNFAYLRIVLRFCPCTE